MIIANPIFDSIFKYLLLDLKAARLLIELITGYKVLKITPINKEFIKMNQDKVILNSDYMKELTKEYRLDFACTISIAGGKQKLIIIELQRANLVSDIVRFRKYIGFHYLLDHDTPEPFDIQGIYFLGQGDKYTKDHLATISVPVTFDLETKRPINKKSTFIQKLTHSIIVINIQALNKVKKNTELYQVLQIFNQRRTIVNTQSKYIEIDETKFPNKYRALLDVLNADTLDPKVSLLLTTEALIEEDRAKENKKLRDRMLKMQEEAQRKQEEAQRKQEEAQRKQEEAQLNAIKGFLQLGSSPDFIASCLNLTLDEVKKIIIEIQHH